MMLELNMDDTIPEFILFFDARLKDKNIANCEIIINMARTTGANFLMF